MTNTLFLLTFTILLISACNSDNQAKNSTLEGVDWALSELNGQIPDFEQDDSNRPFIHFDHTEERVFGSTSCNRFSGNYEIDKESMALSFHQLASTKMACPDMSIENEYVAMLEDVSSFKKKFK